MSLRAHHRHAWSMDGQCRTRPRQSHRSLHPRPCRRLLRRQDLDHLARVFRKLRRRNVEFFIGRALKGDAQHHPRPVHGHPVSRSGVAYQPPCLPPPLTSAAVVPGSARDRQALSCCCSAPSVHPQWQRHRSHGRGGGGEATRLVGPTGRLPGPLPRVRTTQRRPRGGPPDVV
jgi:hypothetical protein